MYHFTLTNYTPSIQEYEFKAHADGVDEPIAYIWVTHRNDQTEIVLELTEASGIPNTPEERVEFLLVNAREIHQAISNAQKD